MSASDRGGSVGAGDDAIQRIEADLVADDPNLVESFRRWHSPVDANPSDHGTVRVGGWTLVVVVEGLAWIAAGPSGVLLMTLIWALTWICVSEEA